MTGLAHWGNLNAPELESSKEKSTRKLTIMEFRRYVLFRIESTLWYRTKIFESEDNGDTLGGVSLVL